MLGNQMLNSVWEFEENLNRLKRDTSCEAGKKRLVNHTRARSLASAGWTVGAAN